MPQVFEPEIGLASELQMFREGRHQGATLKFDQPKFWVINRQRDNSGIQVAGAQAFDLLVERLGHNGAGNGRISQFESLKKRRHHTESGSILTTNPNRPFFAAVIPFYL